MPRRRAGSCLIEQVSALAKVIHRLSRAPDRALIYDDETRLSEDCHRALCRLLHCDCEFRSGSIPAADSRLTDPSWRVGLPSESGPYLRAGVDRQLGATC